MSAMGVIAGAATVSAAELERPAVAELLAGERLRSVSVESRLLLAAARLALREARADADTLGVVVATRHAGLQDYVELFREGTDAERPRVRPAKGPQAGLTAPAAEISIRLPAAGPNATVCNGAVGGLDALRYAADRLAAGEADAMLVCELELAPAVMRGDAVEAPHMQRAAVVVLEREQAVRARGATPWARVGAVATAFSPTGDTTEAQARATDQALAAAGAAAGDADALAEVCVAAAAAGDADALTVAGGTDGDGADANDAGVVSRLAAALTACARGEAHGPQLLQAHEAGAAGAAVVALEPQRRR
jgi:3-oxoacyl-[acyl-carrier-protein] synthase II